MLCLPGDLLVTLSRSADSGLYTCEVINSEGIDTATSHVKVTGRIYEPSSSRWSTDTKTPNSHISQIFFAHIHTSYSPITSY